MNSNQQEKTPIVLDVTLRDGGYLNDWHFSPEAIDLAVSTGCKADADVLEIGYCDDEEGLPTAASCPVEMIRRARELAGRRRLAGMIRPSVKNPVAVLSKRQGLLNMLRIPVDVRNPEPALQLAELIHRHQFDVTLNLTSISCFTTEQFRAVACQAPHYVTAIYLADSRGAIPLGQVSEVVAAVRSEWSGAIGYHAHDSLGLAVATTQEALQAGCVFIDGSTAGVGIGGRNLRLKDAVNLASELRSDLDPDPQAFAVTEEDLGVGAPGEDAPHYRLAGQCNIRQEWVGPLIARLGLRDALSLIESLPRRVWFDEEDMEPFIASITGEKEETC